MAGKVFYVLACLDCGGLDESRIIPFSSPEERGRWASEHTAASGHSKWWVKDVDDEGRQA